jgi:hypothetical protein
MRRWGKLLKSNNSHRALTKEAHTGKAHTGESHTREARKVAGAPRGARPRGGLRILILSFASLALLFLLSSCGARGTATGTISVGQDDTGALKNAKDALIKLQELRRDGESLKRFAMRGRASIGSSSSSDSYNFELIAQKPDTFVFSIMDPLGRPAFKAVSLGGNVKALDYLTLTAYEGGAESLPLSSFIPIPLDKDIFLSVFSASLPEEPTEVGSSEPLSQSSPFMVSYKSQNPKSPDLSYSLILSKGPYLHLNPSPDKLVIEEISFVRGGREDLKVSYSDYSMSPREDAPEIYPFPRTITLAFRYLGERTLKVTVTDLTLGYTPTPGLFDLSIPPGWRISKA